MKKLSILILAIGLFGLYSCKKDETKVVLSYFNSAQILTPSAATKYVLKEENKDSLLFTYTWNAATYNLTDVVKPTYTLQMDTAGNNFAKPVNLATTQDYAFPITVGAMNDLILGVFKGIGDKATTFQFRVKASLSADNPATNNASDVLTLDITPYSAFVYIPPIYLLGDATTVGWDNSNALVMNHIGTEGQFAIVEHLLTGKFIKFIADLKAWAPQWGTDAAGTSESGNLVYRPTEAVADPVAIPSPAVEADYRIVADTANLLYEVTLTSSQLFLVGDATTAGWVPANGIPFTKVSPGIFTLTTTLGAGGMKFMETTTGWAPQWGTDANGTANFGDLVYRPTEAVADPTSIPSPGTGTYTISVNLATLKYQISAK
jgi:starch-binding outer membrane protein SusE/F